MSRPLARLEYRLAAIVSVGLLLFALLAGSVAFISFFRTEIAAASDLNQHLVRTVQLQAEIAAFTNNREIAHDVLEGLTGNETIATAGLAADNGFMQSWSGQAGPLPADAQRFPLLSPVDRRTRIGELWISADQTTIRDQAVRNAIKSSLFLVLQIFLTAVLLAAVFRRYVAGPLAALSHELSEIRPGSGERVTIDARHRHDEIGLLALSANQVLAAAERALEEERALRRKVERMEAHYRRIFETTNVGIMVLDGNFRLINSNAILLEKIAGRRNDGRVTPAGPDFLAQLFAQPELAHALLDEAAAFGRSAAADLQLRTEDGSERWAYCILSVSKDRTGRPEIIEGVLYDVTARRRQEAEARQSAETDALTQISNRRGCEHFITRALRHAAQDGVSLGILLIDLDGFKQVNDTYGHGAGDEVLVEVARRLRESIRRASDLVGRLGGDEFIVAIYDCGEGNALLAQLAGEIVAALSQPITVLDGRQVRIGASLGIARYPRDGVTLATLFESADRAMYRVKHGGKNGYAFSAGLPIVTSARAA